MAYTTVTKIRNITGFSDESRITGVFIQSYIDIADQMINSYVGQRYAIPLSVSGTAATPGTIDGLSQLLTTAFLYAAEFGEETEDTDKGWQKRQKFVIDQLELIRTGKMKLYNSSGVEFDRSNTLIPAGKPTTISSAADADDSDEAMFTMNQEF